jgi:hypothetical protein
MTKAWWIVALVGLGGSALAIYLRARWDRDQHVSSDWLDDRLRECAVEYDGPAWHWPVQKLENEQGWRNRSRLRKSA